MLKERETLLVRTFFLKFKYTSKVSDALVRRGTLYIRTEFSVLGINFIVGRLSWLFLGLFGFLCLFLVILTNSNDLRF